MNYFDTINYMADQDFTTLLVKVVTIITAVFLARLLMNQISPKESFIANFGPVAKMIYFHMDDCPYCLEFNPDWDRLTNAYRNLRFHKIKLNNGKNIAARYNVNATPTIIAVDSNRNYAIYDGEMTYTDIKKFIEDHQPAFEY